MTIYGEQCKRCLEPAEVTNRDGEVHRIAIGADGYCDDCRKQIAERRVGDEWFTDEPLTYPNRSLS